MPASGSQGDPFDGAVQKWICRENIKNLRSQLATTRDDEDRRAMLSALLAEQETNLERLRSKRVLPR